MKYFISGQDLSTTNLINQESGEDSSTADPSQDNTIWPWLPDFGLVTSPTMSPLRRSLRRRSCDVEKLINERGLSEEIEFDFEQEMLVSNLTTPSYSMESLS